MIITHKTHKKDWQWLRNVFDNFRNNHHDYNRHNKGYRPDDSALYASKRMIDLGIGTISTIMQTSSPYFDRKFEVIDKDKFMIAKLSR